MVCDVADGTQGHRCINPHDVLSSRLGIEPEFRDASGQTRRTSATAARLLSKAFGFPADTEDEVFVSLKALEHEDWQPLPPVKVVVERDSQITIPVNVPAACTKLDWTLTLESGEVQNGSIGVTELAMSAAEDAQTRERRLLPISCPEIGYHRLSIEGEEFSPPAMILSWCRSVVICPNTFLQANASGESRCNCIRCAPRTIGASAISPTSSVSSGWPPIWEPPWSVSIRCTHCSSTLRRTRARTPPRVGCS